MFTLPYWLEERAQQADSLAMAARKARESGDFALAERLDAEFDAIYDALEAVPVELPARVPAHIEQSPG